MQKARHVAALLCDSFRRVAGPDVCRSLSQAASDIQTVDCVVIGAGVVGLACARNLSIKGREVILLEQESTFGTGTSSRHSEVIHAGIYYPRNSLKARLCVEGKHLLYDYCQQHGIPHKRLGKLIVATSQKQVPQLLAIKASAAACGVDDLRLLSREEACSLEPALRCEAALLSPSTGILDSHGYMQALLGDAEAAGAMLATNSSVVRGTVSSDFKQLDVMDAGSGAVTSLRCRWLINAAGLHAQAVASLLSGIPPSSIPTQHLAKGSYFTLAGAAPFSRLIYPVPEDGGLGVHLTLDLGGQARFGPDVEWISKIDYQVDPSRADKFYAAIRSYFPALPDASLQPAYAGIRPKLSGPGQPAVDFMVQDKNSHGVRGLINLYGIESPGLTSSLALAKYVESLLED